jgi:hypothetical protein
MTTFGLVEGSGAPGGPNPLADAAQAVEAALGGPGAAIEGFLIAWAIREIIVTDVQPGTAPSFKLAVSHNGTDGAGVALPQATINIRWRSLLKGPANRGRMYLPGMGVNIQDGGYWYSDAQDPASAFASLLFDPFVTDGTAYQLVILSYVPDSHPRALRAAVPVSSFSIDNVVRDQRRREVGTRIHRSS